MVLTHDTNPKIKKSSAKIIMDLIVVLFSGVCVLIRFICANIYKGCGQLRLASFGLTSTKLLFLTIKECTNNVNSSSKNAR